MIGIITFQDTTNYGAMLQTYALYKYLEKSGYESEVLNYACPFVDRNEHPMVLKEQNTLHGIIRYIVLHNSQCKRLSVFRKFYNSNIKSSSQKYQPHNIVLANMEYDIFIAGSDQIWNYELTGNDSNYLLSFADDSKRKISYASSIGGYCVPGCYEEEYGNCLKRLDAISVREKNGAEYIYEKFGLSARVVIDPTLLLDIQEWNSIATERMIKKKYILVYAFDRSNENIKNIRDFAKRHNYKIIYLNYFIKSHRGFENNRGASPEEFVSLVKYAEYVFTGSFHGLCFSLIYNKKFYLTKSPAITRQCRISNLLNIVGINEEDVSIINSSKELNIDYTQVNDRISNLRKQAYNCIKEFIDEA